MPEQQLSSAAFTIVIEGPGISHTYPLSAVLSILHDTTTILRDSAMDVIGSPLESAGRLDVAIQAEFPREGSYIQDIALTVVQFVHQRAIPTILKIPVPDIVKHVNHTLELAERLRTFIRHERTPRVEGVEDNNLILAGDGKGLRIPQHSLKDVEHTFRVLAELDQGRFSSVEIKTSDGSQLKIKYDAKDRISPQESKHLKTTVRRLTAEARRGGRDLRAAENLAVLPPQARRPVTLQGQIRELDFDSRTGRFRVLENNPIPPGTYEFVLGERSRSPTLRTCLARRRFR